MADSKRSNRRDFLKGKPALDAIRPQISTPPSPVDAALSDAAHSDAAHSDPAQSNAATAKLGQVDSKPSTFQRQAAYLEQYSKNAMACEFEIVFNMHQYRQSGAAVAEAFQLIDALEDQMTVYRPHSEVSQINRTAFENSIEVEQQLFEVLRLAEEIHTQTGGAFDITSGPLTKLWRFDRRSGSLPQQIEIDAVLESVGFQWLRLEPTGRTIRFSKPGIEINLGGIGKGHALDRVGQGFVKLGIKDFVIHGGQSSVLAHGQSTEFSDSDTDAESGTGWRVGLSHPTLPGVRLAEITLRNQALGTSGTGRQGFFHQGKRYGHIIDPRTGWPPTHVLSTTVITETAARADALATAFFVMPLEEIAMFCEQHRDVGAIIVQPATKKHSAYGQIKMAAGQLLVQSFNLEKDTLSFKS